MKKDRREHTDKFSEIAKKFGEKDIRFGQAIFNYMKKLEKEGKDLYFVENDELEKSLFQELGKLK